VVTWPLRWALSSGGREPTTRPRRGPAPAETLMGSRTLRCSTGRRRDFRAPTQLSQSPGTSPRVANRQGPTHRRGQDPSQARSDRQGGQRLRGRLRRDVRRKTSIRRTSRTRLGTRRAAASAPAGSRPQTSCWPRSTVSSRAPSSHASNSSMRERHRREPGKRRCGISPSRVNSCTVRTEHRSRAATSDVMRNGVVVAMWHLPSVFSLWAGRSQDFAAQATKADARTRRRLHAGTA